MDFSDGGSNLDLFFGHFFSKKNCMKNRKFRPGAWGEGVPSSPKNHHCFPFLDMHFYHPKTKFAKVMFPQASVILSTGGFYIKGVYIQGGLCIQGVSASMGGMHPEGLSASERGWADPSYRILWNMVNERAVRIILECILVFTKILPLS